MIKQRRTEIITQNIRFLLDFYKSSGKKINNLYDALEADPSTITRWKSGKSAPDIYHINLISKYFGIEVDDLKYRRIDKCWESSLMMRRLDLTRRLNSASPEEINFLFEFLRDGYISEDLPHNRPFFYCE